MNKDKIFGISTRYIELLVVFIGFITLFSGLIQLVKPTFILGFVGKTGSSPEAAHFFAIVGMFMALFGGMVLHAVYSSVSNKQIILWSAIQKFGAFIAVAMGVFIGLFSVLALGVAIFDLFSGIVFLLYLKILRSDNDKF
ncbi:patatin [Cyclobacterium salsum]|uniref:patatin n=1 Tax=Cyclobacterium salsum TaxID=2666329 RepID=UPI0013918FD1|nr:patatin [Cyclobacterium salsum]